MSFFPNGRKTHSECLTKRDLGNTPDLGYICGPQNTDFPLRTNKQGRTQERFRAILSASVCLFDSQVEGIDMKLVLLASVALLATPAISQTDNGRSMVVTGASVPNVRVWSQNIARQLDRHLVYPRAFGGADYPEGTVSVRFSCGDDGKPASVVLFRGSGNRLIDRAAVRAIARIETLHPMPAALRHDSTFQANIILAADEQSLARQQAVLRHNETLRIAREGDRGHAIVVLEISRRAAG